jgi:hypothetical protein
MHVHSQPLCKIVLEKDTKIILEDGSSVPVSSVTIGSKILGNDGSVKTVTYINKIISDMVYKIKFRDPTKHNNNEFVEKKNNFNDKKYFVEYIVSKDHVITLINNEKNTWIDVSMHGYVNLGFLEDSSNMCNFVSVNPIIFNNNDACDDIDYSELDSRKLKRKDTESDETNNLFSRIVTFSVPKKYKFGSIEIRKKVLKHYSSPHCSNHIQIVDNKDLFQDLIFIAQSLGYYCKFNEHRACFSSIYNLMFQENVQVLSEFETEKIEGMFEMYEIKLSENGGLLLENFINLCSFDIVEDLFETVEKIPFYKKSDNNY